MEYVAETKARASLISTDAQFLFAHVCRIFTRIRDYCAPRCDELDK